MSKQIKPGQAKPVQSLLWMLQDILVDWLFRLHLWFRWLFFVRFL